MAKQTMSEIIAAYNELAAAQGKDEVSSFKNLAAARAALKNLESTPMNELEDQAPEQAEAQDQTEVIADAARRGPKYNSASKRGPTQGIGAFSKGLIAEGKSNAEILEAIAAQFPTAKTTANCIAYYRAKMAKEAKAAVAPEVAEDEVAEATE